MKSLLSLIILSAMIKISFAQLQARDEPRHKNVFENKWLRILDVNIKPGDTTLFHRHSTPSVIVFLTNTKLGTQLQGGEPVISQSRPGNMSYAAYGEKPIFHHVWNDDTSWFHVMDIELLGNENNVSGDAERGPAFEPVLKEKLVNTYSNSLKENEGITRPPGAHPLLLINISGGSNVRAGNKERVTLTRPGQFVWIDPGISLQIDNFSKGGSMLVSLELK